MTKILPVIHHLDRQTSLEQADLALRCGADGIFLISHNDADAELPGLGQEIAARWAGRTTAAGARPFIGLNMLSTNPVAALGHVAKANLDGIWIDAAGFTSFGATPAGQKLAQAAKEAPGVSVFASVAFKYQPEEANPPQAAAVVRKFGLLPTTSGAGTGQAPSVDKIATMSAAAGGQLAVASGMDPQNVHLYAPYLSHILVATGVSIDDHHFDEHLLQRFVQAVRGAGSKVAS